LKALSEIGKQYRVNPVKDMCPVCPNCHAVIHLGRKTRKIEDVKTLIAMAKKGV
jgi:predicted HNH restriction endonuclease